MIKGVNRQIIEVTQIDNNYFERAWLVIKPEYMNAGANTLDTEADRYLKNLRPPYTFRTGRAFVYWLVRMGGAAAVGGALTAMVILSGIFG